jgi:hypothetical protein
VKTVSARSWAVLLALFCGWFAAIVYAAAPSTVYETRHYRFVTDVDPELAQDLSRRLDAMYDEYARRLSAFGPTEVTRHEVRVFARKVDYMRFVDDRLPNTGGVFIPDKNVLAAYLEGQGRDSLRRTLQHEAFHQFAHEFISSELPVWANEGIAQVFEEGVWTGDRFIAEQIAPRRLRQLQADIKDGKLTPFGEFIAMDHKTWARRMRDRDAGATQYNQAWAMVHFLVYASDGQQPVYRKRFFEMLKQIKAGESADVAFQRCFSSNFKGFEQRFLEYFRGIKASREASMIENVEVLSDMMILLAEDEQKTFKSVADFRTHLERGGYRLHYAKGQIRWSSEADIGIYFRDEHGRDLPSSQLGFISNPKSPLNDLILRPTGGLEYRARFYRNADGKIEREIVTRSL